LNRTKEGRIAIGEYLHLASIPWAPEPDGAEHCQWLSRLVEYMASLPQTWGGVVGTPFDEHNKKVLHAVSMLYCTGKGGDAQGGLLNKGVGPSSLGETGYEARSAKLAEEFFRAGGADGTSWNKPEVREDVCRLIFRHNDAREIESDKRLQVFADSLRYETVRYSPNTEAGMALLKERCRPELFFSGWAKDRANFRQWMLTRGWR
jgi:hypothetical protein